MPSRDNSEIRKSIAGDALSIDSKAREGDSSTIEIIRSDLESYINSINEIYEGRAKTIGTKETTQAGKDNKLQKTIDVLVEINKKQLSALEDIVSTIKRPKEKIEDLKEVDAKSVTDQLDRLDEQERERENARPGFVERMIDRVTDTGTSPRERRRRSGNRYDKNGRRRMIAGNALKGLGKMGIAGGVVYQGYNMISKDRDLDDSIKEINIMVENGDISEEEGSHLIEQITSDTRQEQKKGIFEAGGGLAGGLAGAKLLGGIGSLLGPVGAGVGSLAGMVIGSVGGSLLGGNLFDSTNQIDPKEDKGMIDNMISNVKETMSDFIESDKVKSFTKEALDSIDEFVTSTAPKAITGTINSIKEITSSTVPNDQKNVKMIDYLKRENDKIASENSSGAEGNMINVSSVNNINAGGRTSEIQPPRRDSLSSLDRYFDKVNSLI